MKSRSFLHLVNLLIKLEILRWERMYTLSGVAKYRHQVTGKILRVTNNKAWWR